MAFPFSGEVEFDCATPAGSDDPKAGDDRIREVKSALQQILNVDHEFGLTDTHVSGNDSGKHKKVTLSEIAVAPTPVADYGHLYAMDVSGVSELFWVGGAGTPKQLTSGGLINNVAADLALAVLLAGTQTVAGAKTFSALATFGVIPELPASDPTTDNQAVRKAYVDGIHTAIDAEIAALAPPPAVDIVAGTSDISCTSLTYIDMTTLTLTDTFAAGNILIQFDSGTIRSSDTDGIYFSIVIDDVSVKTLYISTASNTDYRSISMSWVATVTAAEHTIKIQWHKKSVTAYQDGASYGNRTLTIVRGLA